MIVISALTGILILALWLPATGNIPIILFAALFEIGSGAGIGFTPVLAAQIAPIQEIGVSTGTAFSLSAFSALTGSPIGGQILIDSQNQFRYAILFGGISCAIGTSLFIATRVNLAGVNFIEV